MLVALRVLGEALEMPVGWIPHTNTAYVYIVHTKTNRISPPSELHDCVVC